MQTLTWEDRVASGQAEHDTQVREGSKISGTAKGKGFGCLGRAETMTEVGITKNHSNELHLNCCEATNTQVSKLRDDVSTGL